MYNYLLTQNLGSGTDFENEVAYLLRRNGFSSSLTGNDDRGVDIIAQAPTEGNPKFLIQCKYQNTTLNLTPIQEIFTGVALRNHIGHPVVFTTNHVTKNARESAKKLGVEIISFPELKKLDLAQHNQVFAGEKPKGLAGILYGYATGNVAYANECSRMLQHIPSSKPQSELKPPASKKAKNPQKELKKQIIEETYREISKHEQHLSELAFQESQHRQAIQNLQKEAMLQLLDDF